jgi:hypothetical protein
MEELKKVAGNKKGVSQKCFQPPRPDAAVGTPLLGKEGKCLIINTLTFSSFLRRSTPTARWGEVVDFRDALYCFSCLSVTIN